MKSTPQQEWEAFVAKERALVTTRLTELGYTLDAQQPHIKGERYLMQAVTTESGRKIILLGSHSTHGRVVIKSTTDSAGIREIEHERHCRTD